MEKEIIVAKYGSSCVANELGIVAENIDFYASQLAIEADKYGLVVVTSGAVAVGKVLYAQKKPDKTTSDRVYAQIGAHQVVNAWRESFDRFDIPVAGLQVTHREIDDIEEGGEFKAAIEENITSGVITVLNENDALSNIELAKLAYGGDNDGLAAHTAITLGAKKLYLMTDQRGIRRSDTNRTGIRFVAANERSQRAIFNHIDDVNEGAGRGGMASKGRAAIEAANAGVTVYIADAKSSFRSIHNSGKSQSSTEFEAKKQ